MTSRENQEYIESKEHRISQPWEIVSKLTISHDTERNYITVVAIKTFSPLEFVDLSSIISVNQLIMLNRAQF